MTTLNKVVASLQKEYSRLEFEMGRVGKALNALGRAGGKKLKKTGRTLSKEARQRIADAQRLRWAKVRKAAKLAKQGELSRSAFASTASLADNFSRTYRRGLTISSPRFLRHCLPSCKQLSASQLLVPQPAFRPQQPTGERRCVI